MEKHYLKKYMNIFVYNKFIYHIYNDKFIIYKLNELSSTVTRLQAKNPHFTIYKKFKYLIKEIKLRDLNNIGNINYLRILLLSFRNVSIIFA